MLIHLNFIYTETPTHSNPRTEIPYVISEGLCLQSAIPSDYRPPTSMAVQVHRRAI